MTCYKLMSYPGARKPRDTDLHTTIVRKQLTGYFKSSPTLLHNRYLTLLTITQCSTNVREQIFRNVITCAFLSAPEHYRSRCAMRAYRDGIFCVPSLRFVNNSVESSRQ